jgi:hypothetical protein
MCALDQYQKECWAFCFDTINFGFWKSLGPAFNKDFDNGVDRDIVVYDRNLSNVMTRLLTYDNAGWFDQNISATVYNVFQMCTSHAPASADHEHDGGGILSNTVPDAG